MSPANGYTLRFRFRRDQFDIFVQEVARLVQVLHTALEPPPFYILRYLVLKLVEITFPGVVPMLLCVITPVVITADLPRVS